ncbi:acyl-CoA dehydrogenase C-terminal domain-containing protein, partial [Rhizobium hidalgonense]
NTLTLRLMLTARKDRDMVSSASVDYMMYCGYAMMAYFWAQMATVALEKLETGGNDSAEFYQAKLQLAEFLFARLLPSRSGHAVGFVATSRSVTQLAPPNFTFVY